MTRETVTRRDWNVMTGSLDGDLQEELKNCLYGWSDGWGCGYVEFQPDSLGRLDSESAPCPGDARNVKKS